MQIQEISLLGFISCKWIYLIEKSLSHSCDYLPISEQYSLLQRFLEENSKPTHSHIESLSSMVGSTNLQTFLKKNTHAQCDFASSVNTDF